MSFILKELGVPHLATYIFFLSQLLNEPELGARIYPSMALTPFPPSIGQVLNPRPSNHEWSTLH